MEGCKAGFLAACSQKDRAVGGPRNARPAETALLCKRGTPETQVYHLHINKILRTARILFILIQNSFFHFAVFDVDEADEKTYFVVFIEP